MSENTPANNLHFTLNPERCIHCGRCINACVASVLTMTNTGPTPTHPEDCIACQHCLAVCPTAAISIFGKTPENSPPVNNLPEPDAMKRLIHSRRSIRKFSPEDIPSNMMKDIMETAWLAPTGVNMQGVHLGVVATRKAMDSLRKKVYKQIEDILSQPNRPKEESDDLLNEFIKEWKTNGVDSIFRSAPHMVIASTSPETVCVEADPFIALSYLDLYAASCGVGVVWCGFAMHALRTCGDETLWREAGVPEGYRPAYAAMLGLPAFGYPRGVQRGPAAVTYIGL